jgi:hypothetical protein
MAIIPSTAYYKSKTAQGRGSFQMLRSLISNEVIYTRKIKSTIVMSKVAFKNNNPSLQMLEEETLMCYVYSTALEKTIRCDRVRNEGVIYRIMGDRIILLIINRRNTSITIIIQSNTTKYQVRPSNSEVTIRSMRRHISSYVDHHQVHKS